MKISIVSYGHVDSIAALSKYLALRGHNVCLYLVVYDDRFTNSIIDFNLTNVSNGVHPLSVLAGTSDDTDKFIRYFPKGAECYLLKLPSRSFKHFVNQKYIADCCTKIKQYGSDVVHFNGDSAHQVSFYFRLRKIPKVLTIHDLVAHSGEQKNKWQNTLFRNIHYKSRYLFIQHSELYADLMKKITPVNPENIFTVYYGPFDFYEQYPSTNEEFPSVLFFGRISKYKGLKYLCEAAVIVNKEMPEVRFSIMGKGDFDFDIEEYKTKCNLSVTNKHISNAELVLALSAHSLIAVPYTDATQSGVVLTAYTFNKPVVASAVGGIPEVVAENETGLLVPPMNADRLSDAILRVLKDRVLLQKLSNNIAEKRKGKENRFLSWFKIAEETEEIYRTAQRRFA